MCYKQKKVNLHNATPDSKTCDNFVNDTKTVKTENTKNTT